MLRRKNLLRFVSESSVTASNPAYCAAPMAASEHNTIAVTNRSALLRHTFIRRTDRQPCAIIVIRPIRKPGLSADDSGVAVPESAFEAFWGSLSFLFPAMRPALSDCRLNKNTGVWIQKPVFLCASRAGKRWSAFDGGTQDFG
jgi:hypothetical protein